MPMNNLKELQIDIEKSCDKGAIKRTLRNMVKEHMVDEVDQGTDFLNEYLSHSYTWEAKNDRLRNLSPTVSIRDIVIDIITSIVTVEHPQQIQSVAGAIASRLMYADVVDGVRTAAEMIGVLAHTGVYSFIYPKDSETSSILIKNEYGVSPEVIDLINTGMYLPPMLVPPKTIRSNAESGYLVGTKSILLGKHSFHEYALPLDVINADNKVKFSIDERMLAYKETPKNPHDSGDKYEAVPNWAKPQYVARKTQAFNQMCAVSTQVYDMLISNGNCFYIPSRVDERIRYYSQGYHVNHQGSSYKRAFIDLYDKEIIEC
ncbi:MAG: hypothetical protein HRT86_15890 [Ilumatobacteraceae bacterium]|nr:hypothetical protein [Ilumatobacteraceae bacterium]